jgi:hypothetical protein
MSYIGKQPVVGNFQKCDAISVVNGQAAYSLTVGSAAVSPENVNHMLVSLNGVLQAPGDSFTVSGSTLTFASNLATGDVIDFVIILGDVLDLGTPSDNSVSTAKLVANAVTAAKFNADVISGQTELAATPADTDELLISDAGVIKRIDYSYLKSTPGVALLSTTDTGSSDVTNIDVTSNIDSTYRKYMVEVHRLRPGTDGNYLRLQLAQGGSIVTSNNYDWVRTHHYESQSSQDDDKGQGESHIRLTFGIGNNSDENLNNCRFFIINPSLTDLYTAVTSHAVAVTESDDFSSTETAGQLKSTTAVDGFRLSMSSGDISANCIVKLYGLS